MQESDNRGSKFIWLIGACAFALLAVSMLFPESWWGVHWFGFLPLGWKVVFVLLAATPFAFNKLKINQILSGKISVFAVLGTLFLVALGMFYSFPIVMDMYGNAHQYVGFREQVFTDYPDKPLEELLKFELLPSGGRKTVLHSYTIFSYLTGLKYKTIFKGAGLIFGGLFVGLWIWFVVREVKNPIWQITLSFIGTFAPLTQVFYDHTETYPPCFFVAFSWLLLLIIQIRQNSTLLLWLLVPFYLLSVKMHPVTMLLGPGLILAFLNHYFKNVAQWVFSWKGLAIGVLLPIFVSGAILYLFILKDHNDPRFLEGVTDAERVFLPLISPDPPLDRYNLLSFHHMFDYLNMMLHWSMPAWIIILSGIILIGANNLFISVEVKLILLTLFLFSAFFFVFNPLLSMPIDWNVFSFPSIPLLILAVLVAKDIQHQKHARKIVPIALSVQVLLIPMFLVNADRSMLSNRLERVGVHVFKTYYLHSTRILFNAWNMTDNIDDYMSRKRAVENELHPYALIGNDPKYANLLMDDGFYYLRYGDEREMAVMFLKEALRYNPKSIEINDLLNEAVAKQNNINRINGQ